MPHPDRILVVQPTWVGDAVMATPTLRAIRELYPEAQITYLMKRYVKPIYNGMPWADKMITYRTGRTPRLAGRTTFLGLIAKLRRRKYDLAIVLPGSFKSALICRMSGIDRIVGYERDGRGFLLTDKLLPPRENGRYVPSPIIKYYMGLASYLGSTERDLRMQLFVTESEQREADAILARTGATGTGATGTGRTGVGTTGTGPLIILNPGAQYGSSKCWPVESFAELADRLIDQHGARVLISSAPKERRIVEGIVGRMHNRAIDLANAGLTLGALKAIVRRCDLMISNDTGPRHIAAALGVPVVAIFGPTHPEWTETYFALERIVSVKVHCGPCQLKVCPLDHRCMTRVTPRMVYEASMELLAARGGVA